MSESVKTASIITYGGSSLKDVRKAAGFKTAKDFALSVGIPQTTYARYEQKPNHIPTITAINLADYFNVPLDTIIGRKCYTRSGAGAQQALYDSLSPRGKAEVDKFLAFQAWSDGNMFKEDE